MPGQRLRAPGGSVEVRGRRSARVGHTGPGPAARLPPVSLGLFSDVQGGCKDRDSVGGCSWFNGGERMGGNGKASQRYVCWGGASFEREAKLKFVFPAVFSCTIEFIQCKE